MRKRKKKMIVSRGRKCRDRKTVTTVEDKEYSSFSSSSFPKKILLFSVSESKAKTITNCSHTSNSCYLVIKKK